MRIIQPPKVPHYLEEPIKEALYLAKGFLYRKYGHQVFEDLVVVFSPACRRGMYFANIKQHHRLFGHTPVARISCKDKLYLYPKASLGKYKQGVPVGFTVEIACCIVHELTHHIQFKRDGVTTKGRVRGGELETTANELEFLKKYFPDWYRLVMIEEPTPIKMKRTKFPT